MTEHKPFVPPNVRDEGVHAARVLLGLIMCVILGAANAYLGLQGGPDHCRDLSGGRHRHGGSAHFQRLDSRREHRPDGRFHRRIGGGGRGVHASGVCHFALLARLLSRHGVLEIHGPHDAGSVLGVSSCRWCAGCLWKTRRSLFRNRWRRRRSTKRVRWAHRRRSICSTTWGWGRPCFLRAHSAFLPRIKTGFFRWPAGENVTAPGRSRVHEYGPHGRRDFVFGSHHQSGICGCWIRDRPRACVAEFFRERDRVGIAGSAADLFPGSRSCKHVHARRAQQDDSWSALANAVWRFIVRPIAVGGMLGRRG